MKSRKAVAAGLVIFSLAANNTQAASAQVLGWNNLGMHCMDSDYSVFSILPQGLPPAGCGRRTRSVVTNGLSSTGGGIVSVAVPVDAGCKFYRLRQL